MQRLLITGNDTGCGKTWVTASLAQYLLAKGKRIQVIKPVETGVPKGQVRDVAWILALNNHHPKLSGTTCFSFNAPMAPVEAAKLEGHVLTLAHLKTAVENATEPCDFQLIEGAGGVAVPVEGTEADHKTLGTELKVDYCVCVVQNRLGSINQGKLVDHYLHNAPFITGLWLNACQAIDPLIHASNIANLSVLRTPLWAFQDFQQLEFSPGRFFPEAL